MPMSPRYRSALATYGGTLITHLGLVDSQGIEVAGGSPAYARLAITWTSAVDGLIRPAVDLVFNVPPGATVAGWRGYSAATGGTDFGGETLARETFTGQGEYKLIASGTGIAHA